MKNFKTIGILFLAVIVFQSCSTTKPNLSGTNSYKPDSQALYDTILQQDSIFFNAYNTCDMNTQAAYYSDSLEFYHDQGGLMTSKQNILDAIKNNICGKMTREIIKESVEVYPINGYGAVEIGLHRFIKINDQNAPSIPGKFILIWKQENNKWKITRVVSIH